MTNDPGFGAMQCVMAKSGFRPLTHLQAHKSSAPAPVTIPFLVKVADECDASTRRRPAAGWMALIRVVMRQQTITGSIGIVAEPHMTAGDVGK